MGKRDRQRDEVLVTMATKLTEAFDAIVALQERVNELTEKENERTTQDYSAWCKANADHLKRWMADQQCRVVATG